MIWILVYKAEFIPLWTKSWQKYYSIICMPMLKRSLCNIILHSFPLVVFQALFRITVYGDFLPRHVFYRFHAVCSYLRCIFVVLCVLLWWPSFDVILVDQVSVVIPLLKVKSSSKVAISCPESSVLSNFFYRVNMLFFAYPDSVLLSFPWSFACTTFYHASEVIPQANWHDWGGHYWYSFPHLEL